MLDLSFFGLKMVIFKEQEFVVFQFSENRNIGRLSTLSLRGAYTDDICKTYARKGFQLLTYKHPANNLITPMSINKTTIIK